VTVCAGFSRNLLYLYCFLFHFCQQVSYCQLCYIAVNSVTICQFCYHSIGFKIMHLLCINISITLCICNYVTTLHMIESTFIYQLIWMQFIVTLQNTFECILCINQLKLPHFCFFHATFFLC